MPEIVTATPHSKRETMSTAEYLISQCKTASHKEVSETKGGWLLTFYMQGSAFPVHVSVMKTGRFLVMLPIGNKVHDDFFSPSDGALLRAYFESLTV